MAKKIKKLNLFKGAGGPEKPTTTADNLKSEDVVEFALAVSEGPIRGLHRGAKDFFVGDTPLVNENDARNFDKFAIGVHPGYPEGAALPLDLKLGGVTSNMAVGVNLIQNIAVVRQVLSASRNTIDQLEVRVYISRLLNATSDGSTLNETARFTLEYKASSDDMWLPFVGNDRNVTVFGKTTVGVLKEFRKDVPRLPDADWQIRMMKTSPDNDDHIIVDMTWESIQFTNKEKLTYPNTAIVHGLGVANGQFSSIPEFSGVYDGLVIRVPTNYNPDLRTYDDTFPWDGSFKFAWTNNPAWILFDLITNTRYGMAAHRRYIDANRFKFYEAARWCDEPVNEGLGPAKRPRYTYNDVLIEPRPAMEMLQYVAGSFNALIWDDLQGQIHLRVDKDDPAVQLFTPENVVDSGGGNTFSYTFTDSSVRANDVSVTFTNPDLDWAEDRRRIENVTTSEADIEKYGRIPMDFIAVGCTNASEAVAKAQVRLLSALTETTMVTFTTSRQGALLNLYDVILVSDPDMGWSLSGRVSTYDKDFVNFRDSIYMETIKEYTMKLQAQDGIIEVKVRPEQIGHVKRLVLVNKDMPANLPKLCVFTLEEDGGLGFAKPFRVLTLEEVDGSPYLYSVTALEINRNKYVLSEEGTPITEPTYGFQQPFLPGQPTNFRALSGDEQLLVMPTGEVVSRILCTWRKPFSSIVKGYELQYKLVGDETWESVLTNQTEQYISPIKPGAHYTMRVASIDPQDQRGTWVTINDYLAIGKAVKPPPLASFIALPGIFQNTLKWGFSSAPDTKKTEVWASTSPNLTSAFLLADLSFPTNNWVHMGLGLGVTIYYWGRVQDTSGNYSEFSQRTAATTETQPGPILEILKGQITETELYGHLKDRIDLVDANSSVTGSVAARLAAEASARDAAILVEAQNRAQALLDETTARTQSLAAEAQARSQAIAVEAQNRADALAAEAQARGTAVSSEASARTTADGALATRIDFITAANGPMLAAISVETAARVDADGALGRRIDTTIARVADAEGLVSAETQARVSSDGVLAQAITFISASNGPIAAAVASEQSARTTADSALGQRIDTTNAEVGNNKTAITSETTARASADTALGQRIDTTVARVASAEASISSGSTAFANADIALGQRIDVVNARVAGAETSIINEQTARAAGDAAEASARQALKTALEAADGATLLSAQTYVQTYAYSKSASDSALATMQTTLTTGYKSYADAAKSAAISESASYVQNYGYSKADANAAIAASATTLTTAYKAADTATLSSANSYVQGYSYSKSEANSAIASQTSDLRSTVGSHTTQIQQQITTTNGLKAQYSVKVDNNGYVSGFGLSSEPINGAPISSFIINADRFAIVTPGYAARVPFAVGYVNGTPVVGIDGSLVIDGTLSVKEANIGTATIGTLKLQNNAATVLSAISGGDGAGVWTANTGAPVAISAMVRGMAAYDQNNNTTAYAILYRNGVALLTVSTAPLPLGTAGGAPFSVPLVFVDYPAANTTNYYSLRGFGSAGVYNIQVQASVLETKR